MLRQHAGTLEAIRLSVFAGVLCLQAIEVCAAEVTCSALSLPGCLASGRGDVGAALPRFTRRQAVAGGTPGAARLGERPTTLIPPILAIECCSGGNYCSCQGHGLHVGFVVV